MKFTILSTELLKGISKVSKALPSKSVEPIIENCLFTTTDNGLDIEGTDKYVTINTLLPLVSVEESGSIVIPVKQLSTILRDMPEQNITLATKSDTVVECTWGNGSTTMPAYQAMDFPIAPKMTENDNRVSVSSTVLLDALASTLYAASADDTRPVITSVLVDIDTTHTSFVATDLQCLVCRTIPDMKNETPCSFILNKRHAAIIKSLMPKEDNSVYIVFNENRARFCLPDNVYVTCNLFIGKYPNYKSIIPASNENVMTIDRTALLNVVKRISVCAPKATTLVKFALVGNTLSVSSQDLAYSVAAKEDITCEHEGEDITIGFKSTILLSVLSNMPGEKIIFRFKSPKQATLVSPENDSPETPDERLFGLVMPVMIY